MSHGQKLGRYTLVEQLAVGGMAEIWLAHTADVQNIEQVVVIKKIRPHLAKQKHFLSMFLNEAQLAIHLDHPNIVQIYESGKPNDQHFIAMEYIFGRDLSEIIPKAKRAHIPFPVEYAVQIIIQVCEGLQYAHTQTDSHGHPLKIIHRDISPQNVLISFEGDVKILDFGIAKAANQYEQTQQGVLKGKVSYMAPEQILGTGLDHRVDIFCLGAVFYELLTGYKLFSGENELAILRSITEGPIYPPSYFNEEIPSSLETILLKALAKDPEERYTNAWELQSDLTDLLNQFDFQPTAQHLSNFLRQLFEDEVDQEAHYLKKKLREILEEQEASTLLESLDSPISTTLDGSLHASDAFQINTLNEVEHVEGTGTKRLSDTCPDLDAFQDSQEVSNAYDLDDYALPMIVSPDETIDAEPSVFSAVPSDTQTSIGWTSDEVKHLPLESSTSPSSSGASGWSVHSAGNLEPFMDDEEHEDSTLPSEYKGQHESISQILFSMQFRTDEYNALKKLAASHRISLEQLIHEMLKYAKPFFEERTKAKHSSS